MKIGIKELCDAAEEQIETISAEDAFKLYQDDSVIVVDLRDIRELYREGKIPGAYHAPRGMLEFWVDPKSPYHKSLFALDKCFVFYCAGGLRSALATQTVQMMGMENVCHIRGGFEAWQKAKCPINLVEKK